MLCKCRRKDSSVLTEEGCLAQCMPLPFQQGNFPEQLKHLVTGTQLSDVPCKEICQQPLQALTLCRTH